MRLNAPSIQRLLTTSEQTLVASASASEVKKLTVARLRTKIVRTRRLKEKYEGLERTRRRTARQGSGTSRRATDAGATAETMARKAHVFAEVLARFTARLHVLEQQALHDVDKATLKARARTAVAKVRERVAQAEGHPVPDALVEEPGVPVEVVAANTRRQAVSRDAKAARVAQTLDASHVTRAHGHIGSRTQRQQARRDSSG